MLIEIVFVISFSFIKSIDETQMQIPSTTSYDGMFVRKVSSSEIMFGCNSDTYQYDIFNDTIAEEYHDLTLCKMGSKCPLLMFTGNTPTYIISSDNGQPIIISLAAKSNSSGPSYFIDVRSINQFDDERFIFMGGEQLSASKIFAMINAKTTNTDCLNTKWYTQGAEMIVLKDKQILLLSYYNTLSTLTAIFYDNQLNKKKDITYTLYNFEGYGYFKTVELNNQNLISCYLNNDYNILCFSAIYGTETYEIQKNSTEIINECYDIDYFSLYLLNSKDVIVGCGKRIFKFRIFNYELNPQFGEFTFSGDYIDIDFTVIADNIVLFTMVKFNNINYDYYYSVYYFPFCVDKSDNIKQNKTIPLYDLLKNVNNIEHMRYISFLSLPSLGILSNGGSSVTTSQSYLISDISYFYPFSSNAEITSFNYTFTDNTFSTDFIPSNFCSFTIIICYSSCLSCSDKGDASNHHCTKCDNDNGYYRKDSVNSNCFHINEIPSNYYLDTTEAEKVYKECYQTCETCTIKGDAIENKCDTCPSDKAFHVNTTNCIIKAPIPIGYYLSYNEDGYETLYPCSLQNCSECQKDICTKCMDGFAFYDKQPDECIDVSFIPSNTYYDNDGNIYRTCYNRCLTCNDSGNYYNQNCIVCINPYTLFTEEPGNCFTEEEKQKRLCPQYILKDSNNRKVDCVDYCKNDYFYYNNQTKSCYSSPPNGYYVYNNKCVNQCPLSTTVINNYLCIDDELLIISDDSYVSTSLSKNNIKTGLNSNIKEYSNRELIVKGNDFILQTYSLNSVPEERNNISSVNLSQWEELLKRLYLIDEILIAVFEYNDTIEFYLYDTQGRELDTSLCKSIPITINKVIADTSLLNISQGMYYSKKGINIYDINDKYYTDICYYDYLNEALITLEDRYNVYSEIEALNLCPSSCSLNGINIETNKAKCECNMKTSKIQLKKNSPINNLFISTCIKKTFNHKNIRKNIPFFFFFLILIIQLVCVTLNIMNNKSIPLSAPSSTENTKTNSNHLSTNRTLINETNIFKKRIQLPYTKFDLGLVDKETIDNDSFISLFYKVVTNKSIFFFCFSSHYKKEIMTMYIIMVFNSLMINGLINFCYITNKELSFYSKGNVDLSSSFLKSFYSYIIYTVIISIMKRLSFQYDELNIVLKDCQLVLKTYYWMKYTSINQYKIYIMFCIQGIIEVIFIYSISIFYCVYQRCFNLWIIRVCLTLFLACIIFLFFSLVCCVCRLYGWKNKSKMYAVSGYIEFLILK